MILKDGGSLRIGALVATASILTSCANDSSRTLGIGNNAQDAQEAASVERRAEIIGRKERAQPPARAPETNKDSEQRDVEAPVALLTAVRDDLARRLVMKVDAIKVVSASEVTWPDGGLGCGRPGEVYTQAVTAGYRIVLSAGGQEHAYHSDVRGRFVYCASGTPFPSTREQLKDPAPAQ
jgi:hypothetical protein